ncbi:heterokaryon incompatibility protein-domain-containing protein [Ilyonectria robusta]|uniref:heterokaryon incompatibility protein-domain-containing protein n=1 Tax=Ilyonectria robusta TaxID=1079257 RepID=UPI001E8E6A8D|nr:heterokaryon incompatibility protein-domain-containing protein [Ilyonectria robusta]KAH8656755.1 heterokaryon incompatibility protein-domain-containing protein [Ilyonectria robusta]
MSACSYCRAAFSVPSTLPILPESWRYFVGSIGTRSPTYYFQLSRDAADSWDTIGLPHHSSPDSLTQSSRDCPLCRLILQKFEGLVAEFREVEPGSVERYFQIERGGHGLPVESTFKIVRRFDGGDGFSVLTNSNRGSVLYLVAVIGFSAEREYSSFIPSQKIGPDAAAEGPLELASGWLDDCVTNHQCCQPPTGVLPSRVIDLNHLDDLDMVCLVETDGSQKGRYIALSHCWGTNTSGHIKMTRDTLPDYVGGVAVESLPKTFQDAIKVTRRLDIRYLWIDSLCICQDDGDDWARESAAMGDLYAKAHLVIAADGADSITKGIFQRQERYYVPVKLAVLSPHEGADQGSTTIPALAYDAPTLPAISQRTLLELFDEPLMSRAWALQERLLAYRILHFASDQIFFECNSHFVSEDGAVVPGRWNSIYQEPEPSSTQIARMSRHSEIHQLWYFILENFTGRNMTLETDQLPAISGLASLIRGKLRAKRASDGGIETSAGIKYVAGLWSDAIVEGLGWQSLGKKKHNHHLPDELPLSGETGYIAPTWSWASYSGKSAHGTTRLGWVDVATATDWSVTLKNDQNPFGELTDGWVRLRAPMLKLHLSELPERNEAELPEGFRPNIRLCSSQGDPFGVYSSFDGVLGQAEETRRWALEKEFFALVLSKTQSLNADSDKEGWTYTTLIVDAVASVSPTPSGGKRFRRLGKLVIGSKSLHGDEEVIDAPETYSDVVLV